MTNSNSLQSGVISILPTWYEAIDYDFPKLTVKQPVILDVGAAGKGYLVDIIHDILQMNLFQDFVVNAGGDIRHYSQSGILEKIGLEHPQQLDEVIGVASIGNQSLCGSAGNRRHWADYTHIINPRSLQSPQHINAIWVVADNALLADGLSTALYFTEPAELSKKYAFEYAIMHQNNSHQLLQAVSRKFL